MQKKVTIIWRLLAHYRVPFYEKLRDALNGERVIFQFIYGQGNKSDLAKKDERELEWGIKIRNLYIGPFVWQPCLPILQDSDLVIVEFANKFILNYVLMCKRHRLNQKFAFWGHGRNMQICDNSVFNKIKRTYITRCDWWFAYTEGVKKYITDLGFPEEKITVIQNAIDTKTQKQVYDSFSEQDIRQIKTELGIGDGPVGIYCGGIYPDKRINFLLESCKRIRSVLSNFEMIIIGSGIQRDIVENEAKNHPWIHYVGPLFGENKIKLFKLADVHLMPGAVGLAILDSFALRVPIITTRFPFHGPEIEYLISGWNGKMTEMNLDDYAFETVCILRDKNILKKYKENCSKSSEKYTIETMARNYTEGILKCLKSYNINT